MPEATGTGQAPGGLCHTRGSLVAVAQLAERRDVAPEVAGSSPVGHPHVPGDASTLLAGPGASLKEQAPLAQRQSNGLLIRRFWVQIPGGAPGQTGLRAGVAGYSDRRPVDDKSGMGQIQPSDTTTPNSSRGSKRIRFDLTVVRHTLVHPARPGGEQRPAVGYPAWLLGQQPCPPFCRPDSSTTSIRRHRERRQLSSQPSGLPSMAGGVQAADP